MYYGDKNMVILGGGESGTGAAVLAARLGYRVFVSDASPIKAAYKGRLMQHHIAFEEGGHSSRVLTADEVVKSPGIPESSTIMQQVRGAGIGVISEIEFAGRHSGARHLCITGSNGKTTTTLLTWHILHKAGKNVGLAGNVGMSFAYQVATQSYDTYVLEISSFQLDDMFRFKADIAVLTNITPDHLDRYEGSFKRYAASKMRIVNNMTGEDSLVYNADDEVITTALKNREIKAKKYPFSLKPMRGEGAWLEDKQLVFNINKSKFYMTLEELALQGKHNVYNSMAGGIAARLESIRKETIKQSLHNFDQIEHRLESVGKVRGVQFINDSKATNVNSTWFALESMTKPVIWIVGGVDKGNDYSKLLPIVKEKVKAIICLGKDNRKLREAFEQEVEFLTETLDMDDAVEKAFYLGHPGDVVLLSPACASFDLFENYEERGHKFKRAVQDL